MRQPASIPWWRSTMGLLVIVAAAAVALYIGFMPIDQPIKLVPLLLILACPLMYLLVHSELEDHGKSRGQRHRHTDMDDGAGGDFDGSP